MITLDFKFNALECEKVNQKAEFESVHRQIEHVRVQVRQLRADLADFRKQHEQERAEALQLQAMVVDLRNRFHNISESMGRYLKEQVQKEDKRSEK